MKDGEKRVHLNVGWPSLVLPGANFPLRTLCGRYEWPQYNVRDPEDCTCKNCQKVMRRVVA